MKVEEVLYTLHCCMPVPIFIPIKMPQSSTQWVCHTDTLVCCVDHVDKVDSCCVLTTSLRCRRSDRPWFAW